MKTGSLSCNLTCASFDDLGCELMVIWCRRRTQPEQSQAQFAEVVTFDDSPTLNADDPLSVGGQSYMNQKVANLKANDAAMSSEKRSVDRNAKSLKARTKNFGSK